MECACELNDEEYYFLDDQNTQPLLEPFQTIQTATKCTKCHVIQNEIPQTGFVTARNGHLTKLEQNYSSNSSGVSADSPLLNNDSSDNEGVHCHSIIPDESQNNSYASRRLYFALVLCLIFMFVELIGGYIASSLAVMTDSAHMATDVIACIISLSAIFIAKKKPSRQYPFGYYRAEIVGALISVIFIWMLSIFFVIFAINRMIVGEYEVNSYTMFIIAVIGLLVNAVQIVILHGANFSSKSASHNHSHQNINLRAATVHVLGDLLQSVGIVIAAIIIMFQPSWQIIDPICTIFFAIIVLFTTKAIIKDSINILMEGFPLQLQYGDIYDSLKQIPNVRHIHNFQIWSLTTQRFSASMHLAVDPGSNREKILESAVQILRDTYGISNNTIQVENYDEVTMLRCPDCRTPSN